MNLPRFFPGFLLCRIIAYENETRRLQKLYFVGKVLASRRQVKIMLFSSV
jgi:hypothetical protein